MGEQNGLKSMFLFNVSLLETKMVAQPNNVDFGTKKKTFGGKTPLSQSYTGIKYIFDVIMEFLI